MLFRDLEVKISKSIIPIKRTIAAYRSQNIQRIKILLLEIPRPIIPRLLPLRIKPRPLLNALIPTLQHPPPIPRRQVSSRQRIKRIQRDAVISQTRDQLRLNSAVERVIEALIYGWLDPSVARADLADLSDFPGGVVADSETREEAFVVEGVDFAEGGLEGCAALGGV